MFDSLFTPKPIKLLLNELDLFEHKVDLSGFHLVKQKVIQNIKANKVAFAKAMTNSNISSEQIIAAEIANVSGDMLETGEYCIYRGILSPAGEQLMTLFQCALDELVRIGAISEEKKLEDVGGLRSTIRSIG